MKWTVIVSDDEGEMWMEAVESTDPRSATVSGIARCLRDRAMSPERVADVITAGGDVIDLAVWQTWDDDVQKELLDEASPDRLTSTAGPDEPEAPDRLPIGGSVLSATPGRNLPLLSA